MASKYADVANVAFEVWNEPNGNIAWSTVKTYAEITIATIRAAGAHNLVIVGSPNWSSDPEVAAADPIATRTLHMPCISMTLDLDESPAWLDLLDEHHVSWANWSPFDKDKTCAALVPGASVTGPWNEQALTASGTFVKSKIASPPSP